jgi:hypothetical protein
MSAGNWGGSAAAGGLTFQAAVSAICMVHMACGRPLRWSTSANDTPISVASETAGAGDDVALQLVGGESLEIQAKLRLTAGAELWGALIALCRRASEDPAFYGVLAVGPSSSATVREQLARDVERLGLGRRDDLSSLGQTLSAKLDEGGIPVTACAKVRIQVIYVLDQANANTQACLAHLGQITTTPDAAWSSLTAEGMRMIRLRGRKDTATITDAIPGLIDASKGGVGPAAVAKQLLRWTLDTTRTFHIPGLDKAFSLDDDWIELKARARGDASYSSVSLEEALTQYHAGRTGKSNNDARELNAETLGYFVRHCVAVAGPGMGKTLLLARIARLLARKGEPALIVRLRPLSERMRGGDTFMDAALHIGLDGSSLHSQDVLGIGLENLTILLDGLDEAGSEQDQIAHTAAALSASSPRCRIVVVTRPIGYETARLSEWTHYEILPIESSAAKRGVESLVESASGDTEDPMIKEATKAATHHLDYDSETRFSAKSPLMVALLASLALNGIVAARTREGLYQQLFSSIERMAARKSHKVSLTPAVLNAFLQQLGWELTQHPYEDVDRVVAACADRLAPLLGEPPVRAHSTCEQALRFWELGGIVERVRFRATEALTFVHKTFGEYAAARCILQMSPHMRAQFLPIVDEAQQWNEVGVFLSALGMGQELVRIALRGEDDVSKPRRSLRWARHSNLPMDHDTAEDLLQASWAVITGAHSRRALETGVSLVRALSKVPGATVIAERHLDGEHWWSELVAWACLAQCDPAHLNFGRLNEYMEAYADRGDARSLGKGFDLNSPTRQLWEKLLLAAAKEAVRRGIGPDEQKVINRMEQSLGAKSMKFLGEFSYILKEAGIAVKLPDYGSVSKFFSPEFLEEGRRDMTVLLEAICPESAEEPAPVQPPFLQLSAFWYGSGLMNMELSAAMLAAGEEGAAEAKALIQLAARLSAYDYGQLVAEARFKLGVLRGADSLGWSWEGLEAVDAPMHFQGTAPEHTADLVVAGLLHRSEWIVYLAAEVAEHCLTREKVASILPKVFAQAPDFGLAGAAYLAIHFLGKDAARDLIVQRLKQPLNHGCMQLFRYLRDVWDASLDVQLGEDLRAPLFFGPRTAEASLALVHSCAIEHRRSLAPLLKDAYDHWRQNEEPYPKAGGAIPPSPRGEILKLLIELDHLGLEDLFAAAGDVRHEVARAASEALVELMKHSEGARNEMFARLDRGAPLEDLLRNVLKEKVPLDADQLEVVIGLFASSRASVRYAAMEVLDPSYIDGVRSSALAEKLLNDDAQEIRDRAHEKIAAINRTAQGDA